jgi:hypothetical protein
VFQDNGIPLDQTVAVGDGANDLLMLAGSTATALATLEKIFLIVFFHSRGHGYRLECKARRAAQCRVPHQSEKVLHVLLLL